MSEVVTIAYDAVNAILHKPSVAAKLEVQSALSYMVDGAENALAFKQKKWDGRNSFFIYAKSSFPAGFVHLVTERLRQKGYQVKLARRPLPEPLGPLNPKIDSFPDDPRYDYQMETVNRLVKHGQIVMQGATGCHAKGTQVLMYNGTFKNVEDVVEGDVLMGPDSFPRNVLKLIRGTDQMYRVKPLRCGNEFIVNGEHILSLEQTTLPESRLESLNNGRWVNVTVNDYLNKWSKTDRHIHKLHRSRGIDFDNEQPLAIEPYLFGLLLGDGYMRASSPTITSADPEIETYLLDWADKNECLITIQDKGVPAKQYSIVGYKKGVTSKKPNPIGLAIRELEMDGFTSESKFIPHEYKTASREDRLQLLAGLIDTDGHNHNDCFDFITKSTQLGDDVAFLARSLGFAVHQSVKTINTGRYAGNTFSRLSISGDLSVVPTKIERKKCQIRSQKKDACLTGFKVEHVGEGDYYGFQVDEDNLYLLDDFTITHNCGKSRIARMAYARINRPTLFLTTRSILMYQMKDAFEELGVNCSVLGDGEFGEVNEKGNLSVRKMCVGMVQTLAQRLEETTVENEFQLLYNALTRKQEKEITALKKQLLDAGISGPEIKTRLSRMIDAQQKELEDKAPSMMQKAERKFKEKSLQRAQTIAVLERFEFVILEEAHEASGNSYYEIMRHCKNAHYRLALTGTPFMRESQESNMRLMACSGPIAIKISEEMLIERGILAKPYFKTVELGKNPPKLHIATAWQAAYRLGIVENEERNVKIVNEVLMAMRYGLSTMVLVQHTSHGEKLMKILEMAGVRALYIQGENDQVERKAALKALANGEIDVLIGTTILDVGVDVPAVGLIILAGGGKAEVALRQRIGRGLRAKKLGPNVAFVVDFNDPFNRILREHAAQRLEIIKQTKGFNEGITPEFEYEKLGFKKVA